MQIFSNSNMKYKSVSLLTVFHFHNKLHLYFLSQVKPYDATNCITCCSAMADDGAFQTELTLAFKNRRLRESTSTVFNLSIDELY